MEAATSTREGFLEFKVGRARGLPPGRVAGRVAGGAAEVVVEVSSPSEEYSSEDEDKFAATSASEGFFVGRVGRCARCGRRDIESNSNEACLNSYSTQDSNSEKGDALPSSSLRQANFEL